MDGLSNTISLMQYRHGVLRFEACSYPRGPAQWSPMTSLQFLNGMPSLTSASLRNALRRRYIRRYLSSPYITAKPSDPGNIRKNAGIKCEREDTSSRRGSLPPIHTHIMPLRGRNSPFPIPTPFQS